jgi:hypothetical protein
MFENYIKSCKEQATSNCSNPSSKFNISVIIVRIITHDIRKQADAL